MFYIIENQEQFDKFSTYNFDDTFVEAIYKDDRVHPELSSVSVFYIKPSKSRTGFILPIDHPEACLIGEPITIDNVYQILDKIKNLHVFDGKKAYYWLNHKRDFSSIKMSKYLSTGEVIEDESYNTQAHRFYYEKYSNRTDVNTFIPLSKHQEKWNNLLKDHKIDHLFEKKKFVSFYSKKVTEIFHKVEKNGIPINNDDLFHHYDIKTPLMSIFDNKIYTNYNLYTATGRPSNAFNGVNFAALNKTDNSREFIKSRPNHLLIEMDYRAYHPRILANIIGYNFPDSDIYEYLSSKYEDLQDLDHSEIKEFTFKHLYTNSSANLNIEFFDRVNELKEFLWNQYNIKGYIKSPISKRKILNIKNKTQVLPYVLQSYETERNVIVMSDVLDYLDQTGDKLVMYSYDSFLFHIHKDDIETKVENIKNILEIDGFPVNISYGKNYANMKQLSS